MKPRDPWQITRDMFLSSREVRTLLGHLVEKVAVADESSRPGAILDELIIRILLFSGLRNSECCRLRIADTIVGTRESILKVEGTPREDRTVHIPKDLSQRIVAYVRDVRPHWLLPGASAKDRSSPLIV